MKKLFHRNSAPFVDMPSWSIGFALQSVLLVTAPVLLLVVLLVSILLFPGLKDGVRSNMSETRIYGGVVIYYSSVICYMAYKLRNRRNVRRDLGLRAFPVPTALKYLLAFPVYYFATLSLLVGVVLATAHLLGLSTTPEQLAPKQDTSAFNWVAFIATAFCAPVFEEMVFRGILLPAIAKRKGWLKGSIYSSLIFSVIHGPAAPFIMILSLYLSRMYYRTGSIIPGILLHMANNTLAYLTVSG